MSSLREKMRLAAEMQDKIKATADTLVPEERKTQLSQASQSVSPSAPTTDHKHEGPLDRLKRLKAERAAKEQAEQTEPKEQAAVKESLETLAKPKEATPPKKLSLKERLALKNQKAQPEPAAEPEAKPKFDRIAWLKEQKEKRHAELEAKRREEALRVTAEEEAKINAREQADWEEYQNDLEAEALRKQKAAKQVAEEPKKESLVEKMRRRRLEKAALAKGPAVEPPPAPEPTDKAKANAQIVEHTQSHISAPQHSELLNRASGMPQVQVEDTPIKGAPQVKELEEKAAVADNRKEVPLNAKQLEAGKVFVDEGQSCVLIGPAGSGKTTGVRGVLKRLLDQNQISYSADFKRFMGSSLKDRKKDQPNVAICAFTRRAAINIMEAITSIPELETFRYCCQTIHNLLEYSPVYNEVLDDETGEWKTKMSFAPQRHAGHLLDIDYLIIEEASMVDLTLWEKLMDALKPGTRILFLGDINQLPPVFGLPILAYAMHKLPIIELTEVYRTALGPVLRAAHNVLEGKMPVTEQNEDGQSLLCYEEYKTEKGGLAIKRHDVDKGNPIMVGETKLAGLYTRMFNKLFEANRYDPEQDMIISPFNVGDLGTLNMNNAIAQFVGDARGAVVHEVIAGFNKHYLAVGDKVMVERQDGVIKSINHNTDYMGSFPQPAGTDLSRFGVRIVGKGGAESIDLDEESDVNFDLDAIGEKTAEELKRAASHVVTVELETGQEVVISSSGQFAPEKFTLGYCITGHKSQGSEWRNVYIIMHKRHHTLLAREWLYTTITRAKKACTLLCKPYSIEKALASQRITGDTVEEKMAFFSSGAIDNLEEISVCP